ncbi:MAG: hypothetical protein MI866_14260 [Bacteroidales bacterium]|nr:hypothetical protein [Bacteroidales bacterium]
MATSAVRFSGNDVFIADSDLGDWLQAVTVQFKQLIENGEDVELLLEACHEWCDTYENLPPGLKDIELDEVLRDEGKKLLFKRLLESTKGLESGEGFDLVVAKEVSGKILKGLFFNG